MPFLRPTLSELRQRARQEIAARLPGADSLLRQSNLRVLADLVAGAGHLQFGFTDWVARQVIPDTAESVWLERWANLFDVPRRAAARAAGEVAFTGQEGMAIAADLELRRADGWLYRIVTGGTVTGGGVTLPVEALEPGAGGNADAGQSLSLVTAIAGVGAAATVAAGGLAGGADAESDDSLRARLLFRLQEQPQGGSAADYLRWTLQVAGVTRAWVYPLELGPGTVTLRFMMDDVRAAQQGIPQGDGWPSYSGDLALVRDHLEALRPVTAEVFVAAPLATPLDVTIGALSPDTAEVRAAIAAELGGLLLREGAPGATLYRSKIWEAVSIAAGEAHHTLVAPAADVTHTTGQIPVMGTITYV